MAAARAYNTWLSERYLRVSPRLHGMALLPLQDPSEAAAELRRAVADLGMLGGVLTPIGLRKALGHSDYDPVYREAARLDCVLAVHAGPAQELGLDVLDRFAQVHALSHPYAQMVQMTSIVMSGVLDRFPTLRIAFLEAGASWVPFLMHRMDRSYAGRKHPEYVGGVARRPSTYVVMEMIGTDTLLFTSDFPHEVNLAICRAEIDAVLRRPDFSDELKSKLLAGNARRLYRFHSEARSHGG